MNTCEIRKIDTWTRALTAALFVGVLWLPMLDTLFHWDSTAQVDENRYLAPFPTPPRGLGAARTFISGLDAYYTDHFGFRKRLIFWAQRWKRQWFREMWQSQVIIGKEGWLFYAGWEAGEERPRAARPFAPRELWEWQQLFETRRDWLARRGIHYLVVVPPDKQAIYPEYLPAWAAKPEATAKLDTFMSHMKARSSVEVLDLRPALLATKRLRRPYPLTGLHWNQCGAFAAYTEIVRALARQMPGLEPLPLSRFREDAHVELGGDLAKLLAFAQTMIERDAITLLPRPPLEAVPITETQTKQAAIHRTDNPTQTGEAVLFGDSFAEGLLPFLAYHFHEVWLCNVYAHHPLDPSGKVVCAHTWIPALIEQQQPRVVIDEIEESLLLSEDPGVILREDGWK